MKQPVKLKFKSRMYGQEILAMCRVHANPFERIEAGICERWIVIPAGSMDFDKIELGKHRFVENPSSRLDDMMYGAVGGVALARGKPLLEDTGEILEGIIF